MTREELSAMNAIQNINRKIPDVELRDLFAMNAMQGFLTCGKEWDMQEIAELSYRQSDAMLEVRNKK